MKRVMRKAILISAMLIIPVVTLCSQEVATRYFDSVSEEFGNVKDYQAFVSITKGTDKKTGQLYYKSPNKIRINYINPSGQVLVVSDGLLMIFLPDFRVTMTEKLKSHSRSNLVSMISNKRLTLLKNNYRISYLEGPDPVPLEEGSIEMVIKLRLRRESSSEGYRELEISVNEKDKTIRRVVGITASYETIQFDFEDIDIYSSIPDTLFDYEISSDGNVIENYITGSDS